MQLLVVLVQMAPHKPLLFALILQFNDIDLASHSADVKYKVYSAQIIPSNLLNNGGNNNKKFFGLNQTPEITHTAIIITCHTCGHIIFEASLSEPTQMSGVIIYTDSRKIP